MKPAMPIYTIAYCLIALACAMMPALAATDAVAVPEPSSMLLFGGGVFGLLATLRLRRSARTRP